MLAAALCLTSSAPGQDDVAPEDYVPPTCLTGHASLSDIEKMAALGFSPADANAGRYDYNQMALALMDCIEERDPYLRDTIGFTGLSAWLRAGRINDETKRKMLSYFMDAMISNEADLWGVRKSFAALNLSEVVRADRVSPYLSDEERADVVAAAVSYMRSINDYRGFSANDGWRHAVAHTSDLALQLVLNDKLSADQMSDLMGAVFSQVSAAEGATYVHGEYDRLARPVLYAALSGKVETATWKDLFDQISAPSPLSNWAEAFASEDGLAQLHNVKLFGYALIAQLQDQDEGNLVALRNKAIALIRELP